MRKLVYRSKAIKIVISILAILAVLSIWPFGIWSNTVWQNSNHDLSTTTEVINYRNKAQQYFIPTNEHLQYIRVYVSEKTYDDELRTVLQNSKGEIVADELTKLPETLPAYVEILMDADLTLEEISTITFSSKKSVFLGKEAWTNPEIIATAGYNESTEMGMNIVMDYCYNTPCTTGEKLLWIAIVIVISGILRGITTLIFKNKDKDKLLTVEHVVKCVFNPLIVALVVAFIALVCTGFVSTHAIDNTVAVIAALLLGAILLYAVNHNRDGQPSILNAEYIKENIPNFIQAIGIAGAIQACCEYVSGFYNIQHAVAERKEMLWFALIILAMFSVKEMFNLINLIYVVLAAVVGIIYYNSNVTEEMFEDDLFVLRATVYLAVLLGLIVLRTVIRFVKRTPIARPNWVIFIPVTLMLALGIIFKHDRMWTVTLAVAFGLLAINYAMWKKRDCFIINVVRGVVLQFVLCTVWVWMHRPFATDRTARFPYFFHTQNMAATYLTIVACVGIVLIITKIRKVSIGKDINGRDYVEKSFSLRDIWKELLFTGTAIIYLFFTFSRTGYLAVVLAILVALIIMMAGNGKKICKLALKSLVMLIAVCAILLPVLFEIQRTVPCLVHEQYEYEIDRFTDATKRGRKLNSDDYMTVDRLVSMFFFKIFSLPEDFVDLYGDKQLTFTEYTGTVEQIYDANFFDWYNVEIADEDWDKRPTEEQMEGYSEGTQGHYLEGQDDFTGWASTIDESDYTNGRLEIFDLYINELNMDGHDMGGPIMSDGSECAHAHNIFLEVAYEHGIPTLIVFVVMLAVSFVYGIMVYRRRRFENGYLALIPVFLTAYGLSGMVEWVYHIGNHMYLMLWLVLLSLIFNERRTKKEALQKNEI